MRELSLALSNPEYQLIVRSDWIGGQDKQLPENCLAIDPLLEPSAMRASLCRHSSRCRWICNGLCEKRNTAGNRAASYRSAFWAERVAALKLGPAPLDKIDAKAVAAVLMQALKYE